MRIVIQKFGGTSLRNLNKQSDFLKRVKEEARTGSRIVVVVSAMGRNGDPYATDTLINQLINISSEIDPKKKDMIMSVGETISAAMVSHLLESEGLSSEAFTGLQAGIITDNNFNSAKIIGTNTKKIQDCLEKGIIPVIAGFQGATKDLEITTLGRGGSDTTAVALGGALNAERVDIFTDVPGVAVIDPKFVPDTNYIDKISYDDMYRLSIAGATVIHPDAILLGKQYNIPIRILSTFAGEPGTTISRDKSSLKITGAGLKIQENEYVISVIFNVNYRDEIIKKLERFLLNEQKYTVNRSYSDNSASIVVKNENIAEFLQELYLNFIK
mgnify:CR=1 FL=1